MRTIKTLTTQPETRGRGRGCRVSSQCRGRCVPPPGAHRPPAAATHWTPSRVAPHAVILAPGNRNGGEGSTMESTRGCGEGKAPFPQEPPSRPKDTHPLRKRLKNKFIAGHPGALMSGMEMRLGA